MFDPISTKKVLVLNNLSNEKLWVQSKYLNNFSSIDLLGQSIKHGEEKGHMEIKPYGYHWIELVK